MNCTIPCECGANIEVSLGDAGSVVPCQCGLKVQVPTLSELRELAAQAAEAAEDSTEPSPADTASREPKKPLTLRKKLLFSLATFAIATFPLLIMAEVGYRLKHGIPITGGVVYEDDLRLDPELLKKSPEMSDFLARFQRSDNPVLFYEPRPGYRDDVYQINDAGFRDRDFPLEKPKGVYRIAVLGDSIVWGHGLPQNKTFAKQLELELTKKHGRRFEVMNFGVSGYSTEQEVELYRTKVHTYSPDLVIVGYCLNDYVESSVEANAFRRLHYDLFSKSYLYEHLQRGFSSWSYDTLGVEMTDADAQAHLRSQFEALQEATHPHRNAVVIFPVLFEFDRYQFQNEHDRATRALEGLQYEVLDLLDAYRPHDANDLVLEERDRTHPNIEGTGIAAKAVMEFLEQNELIPGKPAP